MTGRLSLLAQQWALAAFVFLACVLRFGTNYWVVTWWNRWGLVLFGLAAWISYRMAKKVHWSVGVLTASTLGSAIWGFHVFGAGAPSPVMLLATPGELELGKVDPHVISELIKTLSIGQHGAIAAFAFLAVVLAFSEISKSTLRRMVLVFGLLGYLNAFVMLFQWFMHDRPNLWGGLIGNPSLSACFSAITLPLLCGTWYAALPTIAAVILTKTSMGCGVLAVTLGVWAAAYFKKWPLAGAGVLMTLGLGYAVQGVGIFESSGRFIVWKLAVRWWQAQDATWFGVGTGLWAVFIPIAQKIAKVNPIELFTFAHMEPLQILVEQGVVGLGASLLVLVFIVKFVSKKPALLAAVAGYVACCMGNFPMRSPVTALLGMTLAALAFRQAPRRES